MEEIDSMECVCVREREIMRERLTIKCVPKSSVTYPISPFTFILRGILPVVKLYKILSSLIKGFLPPSCKRSFSSSSA